MSRWKPKGPPNWARKVERRDDVSSEPKDGRYQDLLTEIMARTDADGALLLVLNGHKGDGFQAAFKEEANAGNANVPGMLRAMAAQMDAEHAAGQKLPPTAGVDFHAAQAAAERDICRYARRSVVQEQAQQYSRSTYEQASRLFRSGLEVVQGKYDQGTMQPGDVVALGAMAIELLREVYLSLERGDAPPGDIIKPPPPPPQERPN